MSRNSLQFRRRNAVVRQLAQVMIAVAVLTVFAVLSPARAAPVAQAEALERAMNAVLVVRSPGDDDRFLGSAFLWGDGQIAVTNAHVIGAEDEVRLVARDGRSQIAPVIARDAVRDVAVLAVDGRLPGLTPGDASGLGADVWAMGAPLGAEFSVTRGMISASPRQVEAAVPMRLLQHDAAVNPGSSGGPLVDSDGALVGMNSRIADGSRHYIGISYAIGADDLARIVAGLIDETLLPVPDLGLQLRPVSAAIAKALGRGAGGLLIDRVMPGKLAARAGVLAGDVLLTAGGADLSKPGDLAFAIDARLAAGGINLGVQRDGALITVTMLLTQPEGGVLALRSMGDGAGVVRTSSYRLEGLGVTLGDDGLVNAVTENSPALFAGLARGDRILTLNGQAMEVDALRRVDITAPALILIQREGGATLHILLDPWDKGEGLRPVGGANVLDPDVVVF